MRACYTTARWVRGRVRWEAQVVARLLRDARALGIGELNAAECIAQLRALGARRFGSGEGVLRLTARSGAPRLCAQARPLGPDPAHWRGCTAQTPHPGPAAAPGAKLQRPALDAARAELAAANAEEALLYDEAGRLVEGARSNLAVALGGRWLTPPLSNGAVRGVALDLALAALPQLQCADISRADIAAADEIVATNAVRGARPILQLDGRPVGAAAPGPLATALARALAAAG